MKTIGIFMDSFHIGGVQKVFITLANEIIRQGYSVIIITLDANGELKDEIDKNIKVIDLKEKHIRSVFFKVGHIIKKSQFDVLLTGKDAENLFFVANKLYFGYKTKLFISQHNHLTPESESVHGFYQTVILNAIKHLYKRADGVICVSNGIRDVLKSKGIPDKKLRVIYNPLDLNRVRSMAEEKCPICIESPYIIFVGRFSPIKNLEYLLRSFVVFHKKKPQYRLLLVGDGAQRGNLEAIARRLEISEKVLFLGAASNPYCYLKGADLMVLTSFREAFSMVVLEALALGITVVSTASGGPSEIIQQDKGYIVDSFDDTEMFAKAMERALYSKIDSDLLMNYANSFSVKMITEQYIHVFES